MTPEEPSAPAGEANARKPAGEPARPASADRERRRPPGGRGPLLLASVALVLALVALAGVGASAWAWYQLRGEQARVAELEGRVSALDGRLSALSHAAASRTRLGALRARVERVAGTQKQRDEQFEASLKSLADRLAGAGNAYREDEAASLMRLAGERLHLASDPVGAMHALTLAEQALQATGDATLDPVRADLAREIQALKAVPQVDVAGTYARLDAVAARIDGLPLAGDRVQPAPPATAAAPGWSWSGLGAALKQAFSPLVVVRRGPKARPLLPPREAWFVRENVKLALHSAQLALLERDTASYRAGIRQARNWLEGWFATGKPDVSSVDDTLDKLAGVDLSPELPQLGAALKRLRSLRSGNARP